MENYDDEEKELIDWYESEENNFKPVSIEEKSRIQAIFQQDLKDRKKKDARVNFRVNSLDLALFKAKALREGISYQSLLARIVHKYTQSNNSFKY